MAFSRRQISSNKDQKISRNELPESDEVQGTDSTTPDINDVFGQEEGHDIKYKTLSWPLVAVLMITEIVSNGMLSLPSSIAAVGIVPGVILIFFLGAFATYTAWALIQFKVRHPEGKSRGPGLCRRLILCQSP
ncbi:hypothetical protein GGR57DRAFT_202373 [Xylariaceae sp. FL1272]|nr:hypothetical protein GGR57DRAFT_202373 [Xylariaceae sp. FL1272]